MKKFKLEKCPFCGKVPSGKMFVATNNGPAVQCDHCDADGPPAYTKEQVGVEKPKDYRAAVEVWNRRAS